jgi:hypothetical protein
MGGTARPDAGKEKAWASMPSHAAAATPADTADPTPGPVTNGYPAGWSWSANRCRRETAPSSYCGSAVRSTCSTNRNCRPSSPTPSPVGLTTWSSIWEASRSVGSRDSPCSPRPQRSPPRTELPAIAHSRQSCTNPAQPRVLRAPGARPGHRAVGRAWQSATPLGLGPRGLERHRLLTEPTHPGRPVTPTPPATRETLGDDAPCHKRSCRSSRRWRWACRTPSPGGSRCRT